MIKRPTLRIEEDELIEVKVRLWKENKTFQDYVLELIRKDMEKYKKKEELKKQEKLKEKEIEE